MPFTADGKKLPVEICRIAWEIKAGGLATVRIIHDSDTYNLVLCEKDSKSILGKFSTLEIAMKEATNLIKKEGLDHILEPTLH